MFYKVEKQVAPKKASPLKIFFLFILFLLIAAAGAAFYGYNWYQTATTKAISNDTGTVAVVIETGASSAEIGTLLYQKGLISSELAWKVYVRLNEPKFLADSYIVAKNLTMGELVRVLELGQEDKVTWVTIPEGLRMDEIEVILAKKLTHSEYDKDELHKIINAPDSFLQSTTSTAGKYISDIKPAGRSLEGFLYPDTYAFRVDVDAKGVIVVLLENFMLKTKDITTQNGLSFYQSLSLASIVERESAPADYSGVAAVFLKRIAIKDKLGSDITVLYILKRWSPEPTYAELQIDSPYNTRKNYGLTPGPVSNPGVAVIEATAKAKAGNNLFFIADENGVIRYGKTLADHERNVCKYLTKTCN
jgi:UPF0755 protein